MEVSSFELIYKPQSPVGAADRVLQGYFLNITNLENTQLIFRVDFVTSSVTDPDRSLFNNTVAFIDTPTQNNIPGMLNGGLASSSFLLTPFITIPPNGTAKIAVLPSDPFPVAGFPADFEARGYVTLRLPPIFTFNGTSFVAQPQLPNPARVMLTPQNRATYLDVAGTINDQTQATLPTCPCGIAEIEAESGFFFGFSGLAEQLSAVGDTPMPNLAEMDLAMMLTAMASGDADLKTLNAELKKAGVGIAVEKRKT
ncbi:MAG: hypothetical protein AAGA87_15655 [Pseudomonadota bacterium]